MTDLFEGLLKPDPRHPVDTGDRRWSFHELKLSVQNVGNNFSRYGLRGE